MPERTKEAGVKRGPRKISDFSGQRSQEKVGQWERVALRVEYGLNAPHPIPLPEGERGHGHDKGVITFSCPSPKGEYILMAGLLMPENLFQAASALKVGLCLSARVGVKE